jgi:hypothetical protein
MSFDIRYIADGESFAIPLGSQDMDWLKALDKAGVKGINELLEVDNFAVETAIGRDALIRASQSLLTAMANHNLRPVSYYFDCTWQGRRERRMTNTSGIRIGRDQQTVYCLRCGIGECTLAKHVRKTDGTWATESESDLRREQVLKTDNMGEIRIYQKALDSDLPAHVDGLYHFLEAHDDVEMIRKIID